MASGIIALHGFERRQGWQTRSCDGAYNVPFEESRDRLGQFIQNLWGMVNNAKANLTRDDFKPEHKRMIEVEIRHLHQEIEIQTERYMKWKPA